MAQLDRVMPQGGGFVTGVSFFSKSLTPAAVAASIGMKEEDFAAVGCPFDLQVTDVIAVFPPPGAVAANIAVVGARAKAAQTITLIYSNLTAAANVASAGVHGFLIARP